MVFDDNIVSFYERQQGAADGQDFYRHEDVCCTSEKFAVTLNGLNFVKIM